MSKKRNCITVSKIMYKLPMGLNIIDSYVEILIMVVYLRFFEDHYVFLKITMFF